MILKNYLWLLMDTIDRPDFDKLCNYCRSRLLYSYLPTNLIVDYTRIIKRDNKLLTMIINLLNNPDRTIEDYYPIFNILWFYVTLFE